MKKIILFTMLVLSGCGNNPLPIEAIFNPNPVVVQPNPVPVPMPSFHIGEIVFVRNWYGNFCRGQIVNIFYNGTYLLNPVVCNNYIYYYNVILPYGALSR